MSNQIKPIHTCCKNCVFAKYDNKTQIGCELNLIDKYKSIGAEILEAYDEDLEFYLINHKKCLGYRENSYFQKRNLSDATIQEKVNHFHETNHINYLSVINLRNFNEESFENLKDQIKNISITPSKVIFIRYTHQSPLFEYSSIQKFLTDSNLKCEWRLQTMLSSDMNDEDILHNIANLNKKYRFILYIEESNTNIADMVVAANNIVHNELGHFQVLSNQNKQNKLFSAASYRYSYIVNKENLLHNENNYIII